MGFGSFGCNCCPDGNCNCEFSNLYVCLADGMTVELAGTPFVVTNQSITWPIKVICDADGQSQVFELPAVNCNATDCQELDLTGTMVGSCNVGVITFGNDVSCCGVTICENSPYPEYREWSIGLAAIGATQINASYAPTRSNWSVFLAEYTITNIVNDTNFTNGYGGLGFGTEDAPYMDVSFRTPGFPPPDPTNPVRTYSNNFGQQDFDLPALEVGDTFGVDFVRNDEQEISDNITINWYYKGIIIRTENLNGVEFVDTQACNWKPILGMHTFPNSTGSWIVQYTAKHGFP